MTQRPMVYLNGGFVISAEGGLRRQLKVYARNGKNGHELETRGAPKYKVVVGTLLIFACTPWRRFNRASS